ncbi:MAG: hypothetical protein LAO04_16620 [Acidobacteriia bacterium]|nr:hypothetical protein [Terriglobia bacterium]
MGSEALFAAVNTSFPPGKNDRGETISGIVLKMVAIALTNRMNRSGECWSSYSTIAKDAGGIDRGATIQATKWLEGLGLLSKERGTRRASNSWRLKREAVKEEGGRWHFSGWGFIAPTSGVTPPVEPPDQSSHPTGCVTQPGGCATQPALVVSPNPNDPLKDPGKDLIEREKEIPETSSDSIPDTETPAPETKTEPVEPVSTPPVEPEVSVHPAAQSAATLPQVAAPPERRLIPVTYLSPNPVTPPDPEAEKLVEMFLNYQGNPGYNEKNTLLYWHSVLSRLRKTYPSLAAYMKFGFEADPFWSDGKLIRGKDSKGKGGKKYPDPLDYFEDMLGHIVTNFNRLQKGKAAAKARKAAAPAKVLLAQDRLKTRDELLDLACAQDENGPTLVPVREYVRAHEEEYRKDPELHGEIQWRKWL